MPPRYTYWTIIAGGLPTAFRAAEQSELLPTFKRIQEKHPDAEMKWFARGKLWDSPDAVREDTERRRAPAEPRGRDWRPGGEHRDPRQPFKDAKKERNQDRRKQRFERKHRPDRLPREKPHGDPLRAEIQPSDRPPRPKGPAGPAGPARPPRPVRPARPLGPAAQSRPPRPAGPAGWKPRPSGPGRSPHGAPKSHHGPPESGHSVRPGRPVSPKPRSGGGGRPVPPKPRRGGNE